MVHPHPRATSTKYSSLYYIGQAVTTWSFNDPYFTQDKRSAQLARSFFLALSTKPQQLALSLPISLQSCTEHLRYTSDHIDPTTSTKPLAIHHKMCYYTLPTLPKYLFIDYKMGLIVGKPTGRHPFPFRSTQNPKRDPKIGLASLISASRCAPSLASCRSPKNGQI